MQITWNVRAHTVRFMAFLSYTLQLKHTCGEKVKKVKKANLYSALYISSLSLKRSDNMAPV